MKIYKVKIGKENIITDWCTKINTELMYEAIQSLREESCKREIFGLFKVQESFYLVAHMEGDNIVPANPLREINVQHRAVMDECINSLVPIEVLYDLSI